MRAVDVVMTHPVDGFRARECKRGNCEIVAEVQPKSSKGIHTTPPSVVVHEFLKLPAATSSPNYSAASIGWPAFRSTTICGGHGEHEILPGRNRDEHLTCLMIAGPLPKE